MTDLINNYLIQIIFNNRPIDKKLEFVLNSEQWPWEHGEIVQKMCVAICKTLKIPKNEAHRQVSFHLKKTDTYGVARTSHEFSSKLVDRIYITHAIKSALGALADDNPKYRSNHWGEPFLTFKIKDFG